MEVLPALGELPTWLILCTRVPRICRTRQRHKLRGNQRNQGNTLPELAWRWQPLLVQDRARLLQRLLQQAVPWSPYRRALVLPRRRCGHLEQRHLVRAERLPMTSVNKCSRRLRKKRRPKLRTFKGILVAPSQSFASDTTARKHSPKPKVGSPSSAKRIFIPVGQGM